MVSGYTAYEIDAASREKLLEIFPPKYPDVIAHHITHKFGTTAADVPPQPQKVSVLGYHDSGSIQVLAVRVDGENRQAGETEKFLHITLSLDRAQGANPRKSNDVLKKIAEEKGEVALYNLPEPVEVSVKPVFITSEAHAKLKRAATARGPRI